MSKEYKSIKVIDDIVNGEHVTRVELTQSPGGKLLLKVWELYRTENGFGYRSPKFGAVGLNIPITAEGAKKLAAAATQAAEEVEKANTVTHVSLPQTNNPLEALAALLMSNPEMLKSLTSAMVTPSPTPKGKKTK